MNTHSPISLMLSPEANQFILEQAEKVFDERRYEADGPRTIRILKELGFKEKAAELQNRLELETVKYI